MSKNWLLVFIIAVLASCSTDVGNFQIGEDLVKSKSKIMVVDSFAVKLSTVKIDSVATSSPSTALVGKYTNSLIGSTEMRHYFNVDLASSYSSLDQDKDIFDSITVKFSYSGFSIGDTLSPVTFSLHRLTEELELAIDANRNEYLYNTSSFDYDPTPLGTYSFVPRPSQDSIEFRLNDAFGEEILNWIYTDESSDKNTNFLEKLKGFVMVPESNANVILGFDNTSTSGLGFKIYTHIADMAITEKTYLFNVSTKGSNFNQSIADRSGTDFDQLQSQEEKISTNLTNHISYIQGTSGVISRIDFPSLGGIFAYENMVLIKAELVLAPSYDNDMDNLPSTLNFLSTNKFNEYSTNNTLTISTSTGATVAVSASLSADVLNGKYSYTADVTNYLQSALSNYMYDANNGLFVSMPSTNFLNQAPLLFLEDGSSANTKPKLNLYFLKYE